MLISEVFAAVEYFLMKCSGAEVAVAGLCHVNPYRHGYSVVDTLINQPINEWRKNIH